MAKQRYRYDVFVSYSHRDAGWVREWLIPILQRSRLKTCIDQTCFAPGASVLHEMERAVQQSRKTAIVLTPSYLASQWAGFEQTLAQTLDPAASAHRVIPLLLAPCKLPARLAMLNHIDFTNAADRETGAATLVAAIRARSGRESQRSRPPKRVRQSLLEYIRHRYEHLDFKGMGISDRVPLQLRLADMYVPLNARVELPEGETWSRDLRVAGRAITKDVGAAGQRMSEPRPVAGLLREYDGVIILGDPGAGKTTFLKYLAVQIALGHGSDFGLEGKLPVLLPLSGYAHALASRDIPVRDFLAEYYRGLGVDLPVRDLVDDALASGDALLLMDGLDEVRELAHRHVVVDRVVDFFTFYRTRDEKQSRRNKFVLTSRIVGYRDVRRSIEGIVECTLVDFGRQDILEFVQKWTAAIEQAARGQSPVAMQESKREREELIAAIDRSPGVRGLAANPLLLTILALMKRQGISLPERRVELYQKYVETLLKHWNLARSLGRPLTRDLDVTETVKVLAPLALWMHETSLGVGLVKREEMRRKLEVVYSARGIPEPGRLADQFLADVRDHAGLLLERGPGQYGFIHLTFQEYLASAGVALQGQLSIEPVMEILASHIGEATWHEVSALAIAHLGIVQQRDEAASAVVQRLLEVSPGQPGEAVVLAGEAVADMAPGGVTAATRTASVNALLSTMAADEHVKPQLRASAGTALGRLGDPRFDEDHWFLPRSTLDGKREPLLGFVEIPAGRSWMGSNKSHAAHSPDETTSSPPVDLQAYNDEIPPHEVDLPVYYIARYPVTVAQFGAFVRDSHFDVGGRDLARGIPNHPVVLVSFREALAYCEWLTDTLRTCPDTPETLAKLLRDDRSQPAQWRINLPTEAEWEKAARGTQGQVFPWGHEVHVNRANYEDTGLANTSAVGSFIGGRSPYSLDDMSGNVWEWTRTLWGKNPAAPDFVYPYDANDGRENANAPPETLRVVRGGSHDSGPWNIRSAVRIGLLPLAQTRSVGFRVALTASG